MPQTQSAKKALRQELRRQKINRRNRQQTKKVVNQARKELDAKKLNLVASALDRAAKKGIIHKNKASRLKSRLAKASQKSSKHSA